MTTDIENGKLTLTGGRFYAEPIFLLRWRMEYADGSSRTCQWNSDVELSSRCPRDGLIRVSIEGVDRRSNMVVRMAECSGHEFVKIGWNRVNATPLGLRHLTVEGVKIPVREINNLGHIHGIMLTTRREKMLVRIDGAARLTRGAETLWYRYGKPLGAPP